MRFGGRLLLKFDPPVVRSERLEGFFMPASIHTNDSRVERSGCQMWVKDEARGMPRLGL